MLAIVEARFGYCSTVFLLLPWCILDVVQGMLGVEGMLGVV